jgi:hypothetical protein
MFAPNEIKSEGKNGGKTNNSILWIEAIAFGFIIFMTWLTEVARLPHLLWGEAFQPNWSRAILRTGVLVAIWLWVHMSTRQLLRRLHHLEEFLRVCSWCRKVCHDGAWLEMEGYFNSKFSTKTTHGMCPTCMKKKVGELTAHETHSQFAK